MEAVCGDHGPGSHGSAINGLAFLSPLSGFPILPGPQSSEPGLSKCWSADLLSCTLYQALYFLYLT